MAVIGRRIEKKSGQTEIDFNNKLRDAVSFLNDNYNIKVPVNDPEKLQFSYKGSDNRYKYEPTFEDVTLHFEEANKSISDQTLLKIIMSPNYIEPYDPIKEYFDSIRGTYKGESHIDLLCRHFIPRVFDDNTPEFYRKRTDYLIKKWLVACVGCWLDHKPNPVALGLISAKGAIGKTYFTKFLLPDCLSDYYISPSKNDKVFDMEQGYVRYMLINFEELEGINKGSINTFKKLQTEDKILTKFRNERLASRKPRLACTMFTTNFNQEAGGFILPSYGDTRRFGCIELEPYGINKAYSELVDIDQLWSEALNLYEGTDFDSEFNMDDFDDFVAYNVRYTFESAAMSKIQAWLSIPDDGEDGEKLNSSEIIRRLVEAKHIKQDELGPKDNKINVRTIGMALSSLGFQYVGFRDPLKNNEPRKGWHVKFNI